MYSEYTVLLSEIMVTGEDVREMFQAGFSNLCFKVLDPKSELKNGMK